MEFKKISIIIPSYNSQNTLYLCLEALKKQTYKDFEVIIVDSSPNKEVDEVASGFHDIIFIKKTERIYPGMARNIGAENAKGDVLVFLDSDIILENDALEKIYKYYKEGYRVFGGAQKLKHYPNFSWTSLLEHYIFFHQYQDTRNMGRRNNLSSSLLILEKDLFFKKGLFSDIPRMQDTELTERLRKENVKLFFIPDIVGHKIYETSFLKILRKTYLNGNNLLYIRYAGSINLLQKFILIIFLPIIALAKFTRINLRNIIFNNAKDKLFGLLVSPVVYFCGIYWMAGMYNALFFNKGISGER